MNVEIKMLKEFAPSQLILICGLPGTAYIGKLSVDYLIQQLKAELVGEVYSKYFPPFVVIKEDGLVELLRNELHQFKSESGRTIVFLSGNSQAYSPECQYEIAEAVLEWAINNGVQRIYSVAAYVTERTFEAPNVYCTTTTLALREEAKVHGAQLLDNGIIGGENGIITGLQKEKCGRRVFACGNSRVPDFNWRIRYRSTGSEGGFESANFNVEFESRHGAYGKAGGTDG